MTLIHAPKGVVSTGVGYRRLEFIDGICPDPGLNAGERAHLTGLGYRFDDTDVEPAAPVAQAEADTEPAKPKRTSRARTRKPTTDVEQSADADTPIQEPTSE